MFPPRLVTLAATVLTEAKAKGLHIATAESCTGGLISALLTEIPGSSDVVERGFVTYSNDAKIETIGVPEALIAAHGAVSEPVARAMAEGAIRHARAELAVAVTGVAGPGGGTADKPVGLVHIAAARESGETLHEEHCFGDIGRSQVRMQTVEAALRLLLKLL
jgi:nicotinamide-nucleotide amidase